MWDSSLSFFPGAGVAANGPFSHYRRPSTTSSCPPCRWTERKAWRWQTRGLAGLAGRGGGGAGFCMTCAHHEINILTGRGPEGAPQSTRLGLGFGERRRGACVKRPLPRLTRLPRSITDLKKLMPVSYSPGLVDRHCSLPQSNPIFD